MPHDFHRAHVLTLDLDVLTLHEVEGLQHDFLRDDRDLGGNSAHSFPFIDELRPLLDSIHQHGFRRFVHDSSDGRVFQYTGWRDLIQGLEYLSS